MLGHGSKNSLFAREVLVKRAHRKASLGCNFVGGQTTDTFSVNNLRGGFEYGVNGELSAFLGRLLTHDLRRQLVGKRHCGYLRQSHKSSETFK